MYYLEPTPPPTGNEPKFPPPKRIWLVRVDRDSQDAAGIIPYSVNAPLWSDGAHKARWLAIPHDPERTDPQLIPRSKWLEPSDHTVAVKSFALENGSRQSCITQVDRNSVFGPRTDEWIGYSYEWYDDQTDGNLVDIRGKDRVFRIRDTNAKDGYREQTWRFPSRTECMVCHSRAATTC